MKLSPKSAQFVRDVKAIDRNVGEVTEVMLQEGIPLWYVKEAMRIALAKNKRNRKERSE